MSGDHAMAFLQYGAKALQVCSAVQNQDAATVIYDLKTSLQANLFCVNDKKLYDKGWRGQYPPEGFAKAISVETAPSGHKIPTINEIVGTKLHHLSPIEKMN